MEMLKVERDARLCESCPKMCRHVCTTHLVTYSEADTPNERSGIAYRALLRGYFKPAEAEYMYKKCAMCGLCLEWCETGIDAGEVMHAARVDLVKAGLAPLEAITAVQRVLQQGNPFGEPAAVRFDSVKDLIQPLSVQPDVLYFAGCNALYRQPEIPRAVLTLLSKAGVKYSVLGGNELCCGKPLRLLGFMDEFKQNGIKVIEHIKESSAKKVVFTCPGCMRTIRDLYPLNGLDLPKGIQFLHITEFLDELISDRKIIPQHQLQKQITYHDSCDLGRRLNIYEAPRNVIKAIPEIQFQELQFNKENSRCCGLGGGLGFTNPGMVEKAGQKTIDEVRSKKIEILVTACASCKKSFSSHTNSVDGLTTMDLTELLLSSL